MQWISRWACTSSLTRASDLPTDGGALGDRRGAGEIAVIDLPTPPSLLFRIFPYFLPCCFACTRSAHALPGAVIGLTYKVIPLANRDKHGRTAAAGFISVCDAACLRRTHF